MANNRRKGREGELEFARFIGGRKISRTGYAGPDVEGDDGILYEVKRVERLPALLAGWLQQMEEEGASRVAFRENRGRWIVMYYLDEEESK